LKKTRIFLQLAAATALVLPQTDLNAQAAPAYVQAACEAARQASAAGRAQADGRVAGIGSGASGMINTQRSCMEAFGDSASRVIVELGGMDLGALANMALERACQIAVSTVQKEVGGVLNQVGGVVGQVTGVVNQAGGVFGAPGNISIPGLPGNISIPGVGSGSSISVPGLPQGAIILPGGTIQLPSIQVPNLTGGIGANLPQNAEQFYRMVADPANQGQQIPWPSDISGFPASVQETIQSWKSQNLGTLDTQIVSAAVAATTNGVNAVTSTSDVALMDRLACSLFNRC
jgi:hypothetical protein